MDEIRLSVALVTRNRPGSLARTLHSLRAQEVQPFEVVVSDDSDQAHATETERVARQFDCRYVVGPRRGLYANRNATAAVCRGTHVRTMDDDHEFPRGHVAACHAAVAGDARSVWIIGETYPGKPLSFPCPGELHPRGFSRTPRDPQRSWAIADGAAIYPREIFERGIRFSERFRFGASYLEYGSRLHWLGYRIRHLSSTYVVHHYDEATRSWLDGEEDLASRAFATLCHSFIYQPGPVNSMLTTAEIARRFTTSGASGRRAVRRGIAAFRAHGREVREQRRSIAEQTDSAAARAGASS